MTPRRLRVEPNQASPSQEKSVVRSPLAVRYRHLTALLVAVICFALDASTKFLARTYLLPNDSLPLLPSLLKLTLVTNAGAAFSLGHDNAPAVVLVSTLVFLLLLIWSYQRYKTGEYPFLEEIGMAFVLGSALGNLVDRYVWGKVTDFLELTFIQFPVFNIADVLIDVGIGLVLIAMIRKESN